jgi:hypothetical protein
MLLPTSVPLTGAVQILTNGGSLVAIIHTIDRGRTKVFVIETKAAYSPPKPYGQIVRSIMKFLIRWDIILIIEIGKVSPSTKPETKFSFLIGIMDLIPLSVQQCSPISYW